MSIRSKENVVGAWAFLIGFCLAVIIGLIIGLIVSVPIIRKYSSIVYLILVICGIIIGLLTKIGNNPQNFLIAGGIIVIASKFGMESALSSLIGISLGNAAGTIFASLLAVFVPAVIIVAIKTVFSTAKI